MTTSGLSVDVAKFSADERDSTAAEMFEGGCGCGGERVVVPPPPAPAAIIELIRASKSMFEAAETLLRESRVAHNWTRENNIGYTWWWWWWWTLLLLPLAMQWHSEGHF